MRRSSRKDLKSISLRKDQKRLDEIEHTKHLGEDEDQNHANEKPRLLSSTTHASITDDANCEASGKTGQTDRQTSAKLDEAGVQRRVLTEVVGDQDRNDEAVDGNDTSHDDRDDVCGLCC